MSRQSPELFTHRNASKAFLLSSPHSAKTGNNKQQTNNYSRVEPPTLLDPAVMLDRQGLIDTIETAFADATKCSVVMLRIETPSPGQQPVENDPIGSDHPAVAAIATVCHDAGGIWAQIDRCRIAVVIPHVDVSEGRRMVERMQKQCMNTGIPLFAAGVAAYPTANYTRSQLIDNADKALVHAGFFDPGSIVVFDAVSLNISGDRLYQAGDISGAIDEFKQGLLIDPTNANLHNSLGVCYGVLGDSDKALAAFETAIWLAPEDVMALYNKGYILLSAGQREQALDTLLQANANESDVFEVVFHIGQLFMQMGAANKARPYLEAATRANNRYGPAFRSLGACLDSLEFSKDAIQAYKSAIKINPTDTDALSALGCLYTKRGESLDVASVLCEQSVQLDPDNGLFRHRLGRVYLDRGKLDHALAEFELAVALGHASQAHIEKTQDRMVAAQAS